ncbi:MAG: hypothetical protein RLY69_164 [Verrucomicrobiota bacterium]
MADLKHDEKISQSKRLVFSKCGKAEEVLGIEVLEPKKPALGEVLVRIEAVMA